MTFAVVLPGAFAFFAACLWIWAVLDCISTDNILVRNMPKTTWLVLVIFVPTVGAVAWLLLGRPEGAGFALGGKYQAPSATKYVTQAPRPKGPDDDPNWSPRTTPSRPTTSEDPAAKRRMAEWEAELEKREAALEARERGLDEE